MYLFLLIVSFCIREPHLCTFTIICRVKLKISQCKYDFKFSLFTVSVNVLCFHVTYVSMVNGASQQLLLVCAAVSLIPHK